MAGNDSKKREVKCPFYLKHGKFYIDCEGVEKSNRTSVGFTTYGEKESYMRQYCNRYPNSCPIAKMLDEKYT